MKHPLLRLQIKPLFVSAKALRDKVGKGNRGLERAVGDNAEKLG